MSYAVSFLKIMGTHVTLFYATHKTNLGTKCPLPFLSKNLNGIFRECPAKYNGAKMQASYSSFDSYFFSRLQQQQKKNK